MTMNWLAIFWTTVLVGRTNMDAKTYPLRITLLRSDYTCKRAYIKDYRDLCQSYGYKVRIFGGWMFFESRAAMETWKAQKQGWTSYWFYDITYAIL